VTKGRKGEFDFGTTQGESGKLIDPCRDIFKIDLREESKRLSEKMGKKGAECKCSESVSSQQMAAVVSHSPNPTSRKNTGYTCGKRKMRFGKKV